MGVRGLVTLLGKETPLSLTLDIGCYLVSRNGVEEAKCRPLSQARAAFPPTGRVWRGQDADAILKIGKYLRATTN